MYRTSIAYNPIARLRMAFKSQKRKRSSIVLGVFATVLASLSFTFMSACARILEPMPSGEMTLFRGIFGLLFLPLLSLVSKEPFYTGRFRGYLSLRGLFGSIALLFYFLSIEGLTLGDAQILSQLASFFMCLMAPFFLDEKLPPQAVLPLFVIAVGTGLVVQIWNFHSFNRFAIYGMAGGFFSAAAYIVISRLAEKGFKSNSEIVFYFQIFSILVGLFMVQNENITMPGGMEWIWTAGLGFFALAAQMFMTWAFQHVNSIIVSFLMYSEILFHIIYGRIFWDERMTVWSSMGGLLIVAGSIMLMVYKPKGMARDTHHRKQGAK